MTDSKCTTHQTKQTTGLRPRAKWFSLSPRQGGESQVDPRCAVPGRAPTLHRASESPDLGGSNLGGSQGLRTGIPNTVRGDAAGSGTPL